MLVGKKYKLLMSATLPNNSIVSMEFQTYIEEDTDDVNSVFDKVYQATLADIKKTVKRDPIARVCWRKLKKGVDTESKM